MDEDNIQLSKFVQKSLGPGVVFENGRAFYELTALEEDLVSYKEIVRMPIVKVI